MLQKDRQLQEIFPKGSIFTTFRRLPSLQNILAPTNILKRMLPPEDKNCGYHPSGDNCSLCKQSSFGNSFTSPALPRWKFKIQKQLDCRTKNVIYCIKCTTCNLAYVGKSKEVKKRWANHKSHATHRRTTCELANHMISGHPGENPDQHLTIMLLDSAISTDELDRLESSWMYRLATFHPYGLNKKLQQPAA